MSSSSRSFDSHSAGSHAVRPTMMEVDLDALAHNFREIRRRVAPAAVMPVIKANAYGHGMIPCARALEAAGAEALGVAFLEEAVALREAGIRTRIIVLGGIFIDQLKHFCDHNIEMLASSVFKLKAIEDYAKKHNCKARIHLDIDTGLERVGVHYYNASALFEAALESPNCEISGVMSHLAISESEDTSMTRLQLERFSEALSFFEHRGLPVPARHIAASGAIIQSPETYLDMVRPGLALFGVAPNERLQGRLDLKPVMKLTSKVVYFKVVRKDAGVSYDHLWHAPEDTRVVTVPLGYGDGYDRRFSNNGEVLIRGHRYPIVGAVCMDQFMVNIGPEGVAYNGEEVTLIGSQNGQSITVERLSATIGINPRELLVSINSRVPSRYLSGGKVVSADS